VPFAFLSHRNVDKPRIARFAHDLVNAGVPVWIDRPEEIELDHPDVGCIEKGEPWPTQIDLALMAAGVVVVFLSKAWSRDAAVAAMEYQVALSRSRARQATFLPVFLDPQRDLHPDIADLRMALRDDTQGFDVAEHPSEWDALKVKVGSKVKTSPPPSAVGVRPRQTMSRIDWRRIIRERGDRAQVLNAIASLAPGPGVDGFHVRLRIITTFAEAASALHAAGAVGEANLLVYEVTGFAEGDKRRFIVTRGSVPDPNRVPLEDYWGDVFAVACPLGPRMVGALVLSAPGRALEAVENEAVQLLEHLEAIG
jgi:hypothetical protein